MLHTELNGVPMFDVSSNIHIRIIKHLIIFPGNDSSIYFFCIHLKGILSSRLDEKILSKCQLQCYQARDVAWYVGKMCKIS